MSTQLSKAYTGSDVNDLRFDVEAPGEPLPGDEPEEEEEPVKNSRGIFLHIVFVMALSMIGLYCVSMALISGTILSSAGIVAIGVGGVVMVSEVRLSKMDSEFHVQWRYGDTFQTLIPFLLHPPEAFRTVHNRLRKDVNVFARENLKLTKANDELNLQVFMLKENEQRFQALAAEQNANVQDLVKLVAENQIVLNEKKATIHNDIVETLINTAFEGESSEDGEFSDKEIKRLVTRMKNLPAITINEPLLEEALNKDRNILSLIEIIRHLAVDGDQLGDRIFHVDENDPRLIAKVTQGN